MILSFVIYFINTYIVRVRYSKEDIAERVSEYRNSLLNEISSRSEQRDEHGRVM